MSEETKLVSNDISLNNNGHNLTGNIMPFIHESFNEFPELAQNIVDSYIATHFVVNISKKDSFRHKIKQSHLPFLLS